MKQIFFTTSGVRIEEVPVPRLSDDNVLVTNKYSCISIGTELSSLLSIQEPLIKKILNKPDVIKKVISSFSQTGLEKTRGIVKKKLNQFYDVGYSSAGIVHEVGANISHLKKGDHVACSGGGVASHAEMILVPKNMIVKIEDKSKLIECSTVSLGAIALNGIRRANPTIGETFLVVGLGLIGQITIQILRASGIDVYGIEPNINFMEKAKENGFKNVYPDFGSLKKNISLSIKNTGFDGSIITAASKSNNILAQTFGVCRKKSRVILVGDVGLSINREDIYKKEIDFKISSSYGPGRYDSDYEEKGIDYPIGYVRWTLNRNMELYIKMIESNQIDIKSLIGQIKVLEDCKDLYQSLKKAPRPLSAFFKYSYIKNKALRTIENIKVKSKRKLSNIAVFGVGSFASEVIIPNLLKNKRICNLDFICSKSPTSVMNSAKHFNIRNFSTNYNDALNKKLINTVFISTRHNLHYEMVKKSLLKDKNVFVEKPMCLTDKELRDLISILSKKKDLSLVTGFNRRFSKYAFIMKDFVSNANNPVFITYNISADRLGRNSWIYSKEGGGRNIGEACHFYDLILFIIRDDIKDVKVSCLNYEKQRFHKTDNFSVLIEFRDGSVAQINYFMIGAKSKSKEIIEIKSNEMSLKVNDFKEAILRDSLKDKDIFLLRKNDKGHKSLIEKFLQYSVEGKELMSIDSQIKTMELTFKVEEML